MRPLYSHDSVMRVAIAANGGYVFSTAGDSFAAAFTSPLRAVAAAIEAQRELPELNRISRDQTTYYAGAWFKYGFHEDGFTSALECARAITGEPIWS